MWMQGGWTQTKGWGLHRNKKWRGQQRRRDGERWGSSALPSRLNRMNSVSRGTQIHLLQVCWQWRQMLTFKTLLRSLGWQLTAQGRIFLCESMLILTPIPIYVKTLASRASSIDCVDDQWPLTMRTIPLHRQPQPALQCQLTPTLVEPHSPQILSILSSL